MVGGLNKLLFQEAKKYIPAGVNSPVRAFKAVGGIPLFIKKAKGSKIYDVENNSYIDYCMSWGALILGHVHPLVIKQVKNVIIKGTSFGAPTKIETDLAKQICKAFPSIEKIRFVNSGTEATMSAIRLARGYTGKNKIIKFAGCYHGHADYLLVQAGSGLTTFRSMFNVQRSMSLGVPKDFIKHTIVLPYNDLNAVKKVVKKYQKYIACIIVEPVAANMGVVLPKEDFLKGLREICNQYKIVLIFDEVITGFRLAYGGAQEFFKLNADLTCLGKIIGGGFPIGAFGGKKEIMRLLAPDGAVYQAGTLSGNPVGVNAGFATLKILQNRNIYKRLEEKTNVLCSGIIENAKKTGVNIFVNRIGSMFTVFFIDKKEVHNYQRALKSNTQQYKKFFHKMLEEKIYFPPSQFEASFLSVAHTEKDIEKTIKVSYDVFRKI
ncbi:MAG: glutamate-1-semialdehyde 2,1-aminomutase [Candidatus Omnitrophica bacterium]|nr:glutamate-1-semialdehyde 2,1-aminomutase [Candidatus Omnitrophota bacterium]